MLGLIAKVLTICLIVVAGIVVALNFTGAAEWGMVSVRQPDVQPCVQLGETFGSKPILTEVRWSWVQDKLPGDGGSDGITYGWGCYYEFGDDSTANIPYARAPRPPTN